MSTKIYPHLAPEIADKFFHGGPVTVSEARSLAAGYFTLKDEIKRLNQRLEEAQGGPHEVFNIGNERISLKSVVTPFGKHISPGNSSTFTLEDQLRVNLSCTHRGNDQIWTGPRRHFERFKKAVEIINERVQSAYDQGFQDGRKLLAGLASGDVSVSDYNATDK